jgi:hypothetical protein
MKYEIQAEIIRHLLGVRHDFPDVFPLLGAERGAILIVNAPGKCVPLNRLIIRNHEKWSLQSRQ